ncbi:MAG: methyltransferase domain-containing protein, partial [Anaerolineae bacterium]|nr:methyltransferase domain-containing protein [Anaerolineae bacterium]
MANKQNRYLGWRDVDKTREPQHYVKDLDSYRSTNPAQEMLPLTYQMLHPRPGHKILDVGCGTGDDVRALAAEVGNSGHVVGVDRSAVMDC